MGVTFIAFTDGPTGGRKTVDAKTGDAGTTGKVIKDAQKFADDANGNLKSNSQKNITLGYNFLNLPQNIFYT